MKTIRPIRRALLSVSNKTGIVDLAQGLIQQDIEILSTGGTAELLREHQIKVTDVADYTGFPEIMAGRVKTLHPKIHGGILARRGEDESVLAQHNIQTVDLVVVNLYPFEQTIAKPHCDLDMAIENIDIGGPTMIRAAAKNHAYVTVVVDNSDYPRILHELTTHHGITASMRFQFAQKAFAHTANYDAAICNYLSALDPQGNLQDFPQIYTAQFHKQQDLRYGENPHQRAAFYVDSHLSLEPCVATAQQIQGKALSYNNIADADAALECVKSFSEPACVIVKHANPCGVAIGVDQLAAYEAAYATDPTSAYGGIIAFNQPVKAVTAEAILNRQYVEVLIAPDVKEPARKVLATKPSIRVLCCGEWEVGRATPGFDYKRVHGGLLVQDWDNAMLSLAELEIVTHRQPTDQELKDLLFAWQVVKHIKSNAIVYAKDQRTIGIGAGQMSRVYSAKIASIKAKDENLSVKGAVMASDAFLPFSDTIDTAAAAGITAIIQPGGSIRDPDVIASAYEHGLAMVFTRMRHFKH